jgi:hypothetical protein
MPTWVPKNRKWDIRCSGVHDKVDKFLSLSPKKKIALNKLYVLKVKMFLYLMINMRIIFNSITMVLIYHIFNIHTSRFLENNY